MSEDIITLRYEVWDRDITSDFLPPVPKIGIEEVLSVDFQGGLWVVRSTEDGASPWWIGRAENKQEAILNYLKARLGLYKEEQASD
ncbi:MAG TPA: hypothetical protein VKR06_46355 [Ktedonosporobacter sp.]|nr:hypothetical protein [Ktedonosporobacter sp.]